MQFTSEEESIPVRAQRSDSMTDCYIHGPSNHTLEELFEKNRQWSEKVKRKHPEFFANLAKQQAPEFLWIGCADSRVNANEILGLIPGELFVHRNVANIVAHTDFNAIAVMQFAIDCLRVKHVIVCGHYHCGGVLATLHKKRVGLTDNWLRHVDDVLVKHKTCLECHTNDIEELEAKACELNAIEQTMNVCKTTIVRDAWERGQELTVHSLIYGLHDGLITDLKLTASSLEEAEANYATAVAEVASRTR
jgi:carbonic anhydrase